MKNTENIKIVYPLFIIINIYNFSKKILFKSNGNIRIEIFKHKQENKTVYIYFIIMPFFGFKSHINFHKKSIKIIGFNLYQKNNIHNNDFNV